MIVLCCFVARPWLKKSAVLLWPHLCPVNWGLTGVKEWHMLRMGTHSISRVSKLNLGLIRIGQMHVKDSTCAETRLWCKCASVCYMQRSWALVCALLGRFIQMRGWLVVRNARSSDRLTCWHHADMNSQSVLNVDLKHSVSNSCLWQGWCMCCIAIWRAVVVSSMHVMLRVQKSSLRSFKMWVRIQWWFITKHLSLNEVAYEYCCLCFHHQPCGQVHKALSTS